MDLGIKGRVALVTAASKGIGYSVAEQLAEEGAKVCICSRSPEHVEQAAQRIKDSTGHRVSTYLADVTSAQEIQRLTDNIVKDHSKIDILVVNAGGPPGGDFFDFSDEDWYSAFDLNFMSGIRLTRLIAPHMIKQAWGRIIYLTSISVKQPIETLVLSNAVRAAVTNLAKTQALKWAKHNVLVNTVGPGFTATDRLINLYKSEAEEREIDINELLKEKVENIPVGRMATPEEIASMAVFLSSEKASYLTGSNIMVDGGLIKGNQ